VATLLFACQSRLSAGVVARVRAALFLTVEVDHALLAAALRSWGALHVEQRKRRRPGRLTVLRSFSSRAFMERMKQAANAAGGAPAWAGSNLVVYTPAGKLARSDCLSYVILQPEASADGGAYTPQALDGSDAPANACVWLSRSAALPAAVRARAGPCPVWVHANAPDADAAPLAGLLADAPATLRDVLRARLPPAMFERRGAGGGQRGAGNDAYGDGSAQSAFVSVMRWHGAPLVRHVLEAAYAQHTRDSRGRVRIYRVELVPATGGGGFGGGSDGRTPAPPMPRWKACGAVVARPMRTVLLPGPATEVRVAAARFMSASYRAFCRRKGIAHRRGYALWGPPGCGKTSFVTALAAELGAPMFTLTIDPLHTTNAGLKTLLRSISCGSTGCVILIEDVDAALPASVTAGGDEAAAPTPTPPAAAAPGAAPNDTSPSLVNRDPVTLDGLLEALDGVGAMEGRLLFLSTNHIDALPPALVRPGVVDAAVAFTLGTRAMVEQLFLNFYLMTDGGDADESAGGAYPLAAATPGGTPAAVVASLAAAFAEYVGEERVGLAVVQGHLLKHRDDPAAAFEQRHKVLSAGGGALSPASSASSGAATAATAPLSPAPSASAVAAAAASAEGEDEFSTGQLLRHQRRLVNVLSASSVEREAAEADAARQLQQLTALLDVLPGAAAAQLTAALSASASAPVVAAAAPRHGAKWQHALRCVSAANALQHLAALAGDAELRAAFSS
jgi:hypothetical protein